MLEKSEYTVLIVDDVPDDVEIFKYINKTGELDWKRTTRKQY